MKYLIRISCVVAFGLLVAGCDKCGHWNLNTPKFCNEVNPR